MEAQIKIIDSLSILVNKTVTWTSQEKLQQTINLGSADGAYVIDVSNIGDIKTIFIYSASPFNVGITKNAVLSTISIEGAFLFNPSEVDRSLIESITLTAVNATEDSIEVYVYGEDQ